MLGRIASIFVEIAAPTSRLKSDLGTAERDVQQSAQRMNQAGAQAGSASVGFADGLKQATKPARDVMAALIGTVGIITRALGLIGLVTTAAYGLYRVVESIATASERARKEAGALAQSVASFKFENLPAIKVDGSSIASVDKALSDLELRRADSIKAALRDAAGTDLAKKLAENVRKAQPGAGDFNFDDGTLKSSAKKRIDDAEAALRDYQETVKRTASRAVDEQIEDLKQKREKIIESAREDFVNFRRDIKEIDGPLGDALAFDPSSGFLSGTENAEKFKAVVAEVFATFEQGQKERIRLETEYYDFVRTQREAKEKAERDAIERNAQAAIAAANRTRQSIDSIFGRDGPESYGIQRLEGALIDIQSQISTIAYGTQPRF